MNAQDMGEREPRWFDPRDRSSWPPSPGFMEGDTVLVWETFEDSPVSIPPRWREVWFIESLWDGDEQGPRFVDYDTGVIMDRPTWWMAMPPSPVKPPGPGGDG